MKKLEKQAIELEEVKRQLTAALRQLSSAEEELLRLRQKQSDVAALEKQVNIYLLFYIIIPVERFLNLMRK